MSHPQPRGVIWWNGQSVYYAHNPTFSAHYVGERALLPMTEDLRASIERDIKHQKSKLSQPTTPEI